MKVLHGFDDPASHGGFVAIGNFDGVHRGHRAMIDVLRRRSDSAGGPAVALTFDPPPAAVLRPEHLPTPLATLERKLELLASTGIDCTIVYPTDRRLLDLSAREFFDDVVVAQLAARGLVEGPDFQFGRRRGGNVESLQLWCTSAGLTCDVVPSVTVDGARISSSEIRRLIILGHTAAAARMLGAPFRITGRVVHGEARGAKIGFPTANLDGVQTVLPADGVYAGRVHCNAGRFAAAVNLGPNPTFGGKQRKLEAHLIDFAGDLYGETVHLEFLERLRSARAFAGVDELTTQLQQDVLQAQAIVKQSEISGSAE